jgi:hypothetical protein
MLKKLYIAAHLIIIFSISITPAYAQVDKLKASQSAISSEQAEISEEIQILTNRVNRQKENLTESTASLAQTEVEMTALFEEAKNNPNDQTARAATLISMTYNRQLSRVERVEKRISDSDSRIGELKFQHDNLSSKEANIQKQIALAENAIKLQTQKQQAQKQQAQTKTATLPPAKKVESIKVAKKIIAPPKSKQVKRTAKWPDTKNPHPADIVFAKASITSAMKQLEKGDSPLLPKVIIEAKKSFGSERMKYIGDDLYSVTAQARIGTQKVSIFKKDFWIEIPVDGKNYRFIYDATSLSKPNLHIIAEDLLTAITSKATTEE